MFTCLCSSWVHVEVWDAESLPGKACLHSLCRAGLSARSGGHWEHFQAGFQHQRMTDRQHQGVFGFSQILFSLGWNAITWKPSLTKVFAQLWTGEADASIFLLVSPCRRLDADLSRVLLLPVLREQRVGDDRLAVPLLWGQHRRLERPGCHHRGALPHRQKVLRTFLLLVSTLYLVLLVPNGESRPRDM